MKKLLLPAALLAAVLCRFAVSGTGLGERIDRLNLKYLANEPAAIRFDKDLDDEEARKHLVLIDFFGSYWPSGNIQSELLNGMTDAYASLGLRVIAVSGEPTEKLKKFVDGGREMRFAVAQDNEYDLSRKVLPGNVILPFCAIFDGSGTLLWLGETAEVPDALNRIYSDRYDRDARAELLPYYSELAAALRGASTNEIVNITNRMFAIEPANLSAAQARLFILENEGGGKAAWEFLRTRLDRRNADHLWFALAVGFGARNPDFRPQILPLIARYPERFGAAFPQEAVSMAWDLASYYNFSAEALRCAGQLLDASQAATWRASACRALIAYRGCRLADAVRFQKEALERAGAAGVDRAQQDELRGILAFFEQLAPQ